MKKCWTIFSRIKSSSFSTLRTSSEIVLSDIEHQNIRNFSIIAHVDHGKSSLSDRLMELLGNIKNDPVENNQVLDTLQVEKERGITVKAQTVSMVYNDSISGKKYLLNLIDTPGHYDFAFEVQRSLKACQGVLFLVDSTQGIQAQSYSTYDMAKKQNLAILPVLTKIDMKNADPQSVSTSLSNTFSGLSCEGILTSAKTGEGVEELVQSIVKYVPPPPLKQLNEMSCHVIDTWFSGYEGVTCLVLVESGSIKVGDKVKTMNGKGTCVVKHLNILTPTPEKQDTLFTGMVGTLTASINSLEEAPIGSLIVSHDSTQETSAALISLPKPMVFSCIFPEDGSKYDALKKDIRKLCLNDASVSVKDEASQALGPGFRCGFVGKLHLEVFVQRLQDEYAQAVIVTPPSVSYTVVFDDKEVETVSTPRHFPSKVEGKRRVDHYLEPFAKVVIIVPDSYIGDIIELMISEKRSEQTKLEYVETNKVLLEFDTPLEEVINDMVERVKSASSGTASFDYHLIEPRRADIQRVDVYVANELIEALSFVTHRSKAYDLSKKLLGRLRGVISRKQFEVVIQAKLGTKVICRESVKAMKKDVLTKAGKTVGGGDITRKMKLLEKQKKGKKMMKNTGKVSLSQKDVLQALYR